MDQGEVEKASKQQKREKREKEKKRKKKKEKKSSSKKRKHESKRERGVNLSDDSGGSGSGSESDGREDPGRQKPGEAEEDAAGLPQAEARDSWMNDSSMFGERLGDVKKKSQENAEKEKQDAEAEENKPSEKELNPYFKDGGSGLPPAAAQAAAAARARKSAVGDGGASWRMKALKRARDAAQQQGVELEEAVAERWGSVAHLADRISGSGVRASHAMAHMHASRDRRSDAEAGGHERRGIGRGGEGEEHRDRQRSTYLDDVGNRGRPAMRRPKEDISASWRGGRGGGASGGGRRGAEEAAWDHPLPPAASSLRAAGGEEGAEGRDERRRERNRDEDDPRGGDRRERGPREGGRGGPREGGRGRGGPGGRGSRGRGDASGDLLRSVAGTMNKFESDGSFFGSFEKPGAEKEEGEEGAKGKQEEQEEAQEAYEMPGRFEMPEEAPKALGASEGPGRAAVEQQEEGQRQQQQQQQQQQRPEASAAAAPPPPAAAPAAGAAGGGNRSVADMLRARLMGRAPAADAGKKAAVEQVALPLVDSQGRAAPGAFGRKAAGADALPEGNRIAKNVQRYGEGGSKERFFADDDGKDLQALVREQRYEGVQDIDRNLARNIAKKGARYKGKELDVDEEYDNDGGIDMYEDRRKRGSREQQAQRSKDAQVSDMRRMQSATDRCPFCFSSQARERVKHLTVAIGQSTYLLLPSAGRLVEGHCQITTAEHVVSSRATDEAVWTEIRNFKKCLLQMYKAQGLDVIFLETAMNLNGGRSHCVVDCIPVPDEVGADAPIYFKQGLDEAESEWSQHAGKRIIDTAKKGLRGSIPANFAYFHVEFGLTGGYAHIIDDEEKWNKNFGRDILIGMLGLPEHRWHQRARQESVSVQRQWVKDFSKTFDSYDWTKQLM